MIRLLLAETQYQKEFAWVIQPDCLLQSKPLVQIRAKKDCSSEKFVGQNVKRHSLGGKKSYIYFSSSHLLHILPFNHNPWLSSNNLTLIKQSKTLREHEAFYFILRLKAFKHSLSKTYTQSSVTII